MRIILFINLLLIPFNLVANDDSWYTPAGIKFRLGYTFTDYDLYIEQYEVTGSNSINTNRIFSGVEGKIKLPVSLDFKDNVFTKFFFHKMVFDFDLDVTRNNSPTAYLSSSLNSNWAIIEDSRSEDILEINITHPEGIRDLLKNSYLKNFLSENEINSLPSKWALSSESEFSLVFLGYLVGVFIPISERHKFFKFGFGLSLSYTEGHQNIFICDSYLVKIGANNQDPNLGTCNNKRLLEKLNISGFGIQESSHFTLWETETDNFIIRILSADASGLRAMECSGGGDKSDPAKASLRSCNYLSRRTIDENKKISIAPAGTYADLIALTYKF